MKRERAIVSGEVPPVMIKHDRRKGYYQGKYLREAVIFYVAVFMAMVFVLTL
ncbi:hypothetical protein OE749_15275 [Aestuariibacter sp. AA17]|uniref:Uncharacterized protein n=1 Tax=Fluctibacter corallii TaxID=2984329 RepID=A0ABT3ABK0_9ALTE|nr:hypothetical protein [Aestuariibacter sp. AA17]MCV2886054.1 hypothetical protein [Aestuariibacter sp. AA17]